MDDHEILLKRSKKSAIERRIGGKGESNKAIEILQEENYYISSEFSIQRLFLQEREEDRRREEERIGEQRYV